MDHFCGALHVKTKDIFCFCAFFCPLWKSGNCANLIVFSIFNLKTNMKTQMVLICGDFHIFNICQRYNFLELLFLCADGIGGRVIGQVVAVKVVP